MNFQFLLSATEGQIFHIMAEVTTALFAHRMDTVVRQGKILYLRPDA